MESATNNATNNAANTQQTTPEAKQMKPGPGLSGKTIRVSCLLTTGYDENPFTPEPAEEMNIDLNIARLSRTINDLLADIAESGCDASVDVIPLNVQPSAMKLIVTYCTDFLSRNVEVLEAGAPEPEESLELCEWDKTFCTRLDTGNGKELFDVIAAAHFLDFTTMIKMMCLHVAIQLKNMTPEEIRAKYNITKEFTPEEEEEAKKEFEAAILAHVEKTKPKEKPAETSVGSVAATPAN